MVYSDGKSIAVAYDEDKYGINAAETEEINYLINELLTASSLKALPGALCREKFDVIEWQEAVDDAELEKQWDSYLEKLKKMAEDDDRSLSQYINIVLKKHITSEEKQSINIQKSEDTAMYLRIF